VLLLQLIALLLLDVSLLAAALPSRTGRVFSVRKGCASGIQRCT
jgi:hypothetical protein